MMCLVELLFERHKEVLTRNEHVLHEFEFGDEVKECTNDCITFIS
jgi:hypothetical protein